MQLLLENTEEHEDDNINRNKKSTVLSASKLNSNEAYPYNMNRSKKSFDENKALN
jgi:hypothetical protein